MHDPNFILFYFILFLFAVRGPLTVVVSPVVEHRLWTHRLSGHGTRAQPLRGHVGSSRTGARTRVACIGRRTLNHCATREALKIFLNKQKLKEFIPSKPALQEMLKEFFKLK